MKKFFAVTLCLALALSSISIVTVSAAPASLTKIKSGAKVDLNGDKKTEAISWKSTLENEEEGISCVEVKVGNASLKVIGSGGVDVSTPAEVYYGDINKSDKYKELFIVQSTYLNMINVDILRYDGKKITRAKFNSIIEDGSKYPFNSLYVESTKGYYEDKLQDFVKPDGKGSFTSTDICYMMGTWDRNPTYTLSKSGFTFTEKSSSTYKMNIKTKTLKDAIYRTGTSANAKKATLKKGTSITFVLTDLKEWVKFTTSDKKTTGYIRVKNGDNTSLADMDEYTFNVFENLPYAG